MTTKRTIVSERVHRTRNDVKASLFSALDVTPPILSFPIMRHTRVLLLTNALGLITGRGLSCLGGRRD